MEEDARQEVVAEPAERDASADTLPLLDVDNEDDGDLCRVCRCGPTPEQPLFYPCMCKGSIRYIHQDCLLEWLKHSKKNSCELCKHSFKFRPVYAENMPQELPKHEVIIGALVRGSKSAAHFSRIMLTCVAWFFCVPVGTSWIWRFYFSRNFQLSFLYSDCIWGSFLSAVIFFIFLGLSSLLEFMHHNPEQPDPLAGQAAEVGDVNAEENVNAEGEQVQQEGVADGGEQADAPANAQGNNNNNPNAGIHHAIQDYLNMFIPEEDIEFDELVGFRGPVSLLFSKIMVVLLFNGLVLSLFALLPHFIGRMALKLWALQLESFDPVVIANATLTEFETRLLDAMTGNLPSEATVSQEYDDIQFAADILAVLVGYGIIMCVAILWAALSYFTSHRLDQMRGPVSSLILWALNFIYTFFKVSVLMFLDMGIFPQVIGWWVDACTITLLGATWQARLLFAAENPITAMFIHWVLGLMFMFHFASTVSWLRTVVRTQVLWFLRNPDDPDFNPIKEMIESSVLRHLRRLFFSLLLYGSIVALLIGAPIQAIKLVYPSFLPFNIWLRDPIYEGPIDLLLVHIAVPFTLEYVHPKTNLKRLMSIALHKVGDMLSLSSYLFPAFDPATNQDLPVVYPSRFAFRLVLLVIICWMGLFFFNLIVFITPVIVGRSIFFVFALPETNDVYTTGVGFLLLWLAARSAKFLITHMNSNELLILLQKARTWTVIGAKCAFLLFFWVGLIPLMIGLLFELLVVIPLRVPINESPARSPLYQNWAVGLFYLKIWYRLVMLSATSKWKEKFEQIKQDGLSNLQMMKIFQEVLLPISSSLATFLAVPYVISRGIVPLFSDSVVVNSVSFRISYLVFVLLLLQWTLIKMLRKWFVSLHNTIRDDKYLIGRNLENYEEEKEKEKEKEKEREKENEQEKGKEKEDNGSHTSESSVGTAAVSEEEVVEEGVAESGVEDEAKLKQEDEGVATY